MQKLGSNVLWVVKIILGCALFSLGFDLFLEPNGLTAGGVSGLSTIIVHVLGVGTVGIIAALINLPLFLTGGRKIGVRFLIGSILGAAFLSVFIDLFSIITPPITEPLLGALYGGALCGAGAGLVFTSNASTGGSDIIVRLLKRKYRNVPIGHITMTLDFIVASLSGVVFHDISKTLYSLISIFVCGKILDAVVYRFDYSKVALIISQRHDDIGQAIGTKLNRGVTYLYGQGYYSAQDTKVILTAVKRGQLSELKELVVSIDPDAFIIVQEAHQVLGDGFARYCQDSL